MDTIIAENIVRLHGTGRGIEGMSLSVGAGQCLGILGANGSGKTTLTRLVAGLDRADRGRLFVLGGPAYPRARQLRHRCGVALDTPAHWDSLSGRQNLWFFARQYGLTGSALSRRVDELLCQADLTAQADDPVAAYSFGMRRKLSIIEALPHDPDLLILDEPSANVDEAFLERLVQWVRQRCECGKTTWVADNDADWISRTATHAILLSNGRILAEGEVPELMASIGARNRIDILLEQSGFGSRPKIDGVEAFHCDRNRITAELRGSPETPVELVRWITSRGGRVRSMEVRSMTLYEALMRRTTQQENKQ
ncbi:MAG: ABC transporter ATP-binding protein [Planctomycetes bacterium]|nr:ABC transporter ATP-binding protein [Planctomycetota bacterium]